MTALVRSELLRLRCTRATWGVLAAAAGLALAWTAIVLSGVGGLDGLAAGSTKLRDAVLGAAGMGQLPVLILGVLAVTGELHHRTATATFLVTPDRRRVVLAKALALALVAPLVGLALMAATLATGVVAGAVHPTLDGHTARVAAQALVGFACWGVLGVAVGVAVRQQTLAVVLPLAWFGVVEQLLPSYGLSRLLPWTPGGASAALSGVEFAGALAPWAALLLVAAYLAALAVPGTRALVRSDLT